MEMQTQGMKEFLLRTRNAIAKRLVAGFRIDNMNDEAENINSRPAEMRNTVRLEGDAKK
jgi:hypothetical protein